jgi:N6-L-threonylcarbamoyladenine synthase
LLDGVVAQALDESGVALADVDAVAATAGPGLIGGVMVGLVSAKGLALAVGKPLIAVNHLEAHALSARLSAGLDFPFLLLLISGGHCQLMAAEAVGRYRLYGATIDDAVGEAFDKTAKLLGLGYPGGPAVERWAAKGDPARFELPRPLLGRPGLDFSFSGLKTAVRHLVDRLPQLDDADRADIAAAFQARIAESLADRTRRALIHCRDAGLAPSALVVAGGVAANGALRATLKSVADGAGLPLVAPPPRLCTDNAAMIAWAGIERLRLGLRDGFDFAPRPRWPLDGEPATLEG